ncbi:MAG TPA: glycosyltransferase family 4 protein [Polyangiales bacterium]|nr:glycosyltransferase family 4 protein [Polyangiales bacterium]
MSHPVFSAMRVSNASFAYFGLFLSKQMARLGHLGALYTNLPASRLGDVPPSAYRSQPLLSAPMALRKLGFPKVADRLNLPTVQLFDRWVSRSLDACDVFHCFSSFGLESFRTARERFGALTVVERGSSHIRFQDQIVREEYARWGVPHRGIDPRYIEREEAEYALCDRITVQSTFAERTFLARGVPQSKLIKLPLGVDVGMFRPDPKLDGVFRVLYAGSCSFRKGVPYLLEAVRGLELPNFELAINGSVEPGMRELMARHAGDYRFLGFQPLDQLYKVYSQASVLVLPTLEDGFAKVVTEAMACGVPVIATDHCGAMDVLTDGVEGFIVPVRDPAAIREKILFLYENPEVQRAMATAALARARSLAGWDRYGDLAAAAYARALAEHRGQARPSNAISSS